jgi:hypothetical protein
MIAALTKESIVWLANEHSYNQVKVINGWIKERGGRFICLLFFVGKQG